MNKILNINRRKPSQGCETLNDTRVELSQCCDTLNDTRGILSQGCDTLNATRGKLSQGCDTQNDTRGTFSQGCETFLGQKFSKLFAFSSVLMNVKVRETLWALAHMKWNFSCPSHECDSLSRFFIGSKGYRFDRLNCPFAGLSFAVWL